MDNIGLMTIVDAREYLLHEDGTVALSELAALKDLIEELTTLANSIKIRKRLHTNMSKLG